MAHKNFKFPFRQRGASAVEFAFLAVILLSLLFGIVEFSRLFFNINSVQEITRRAAREQVVRWLDDQEAVSCHAVLQPDDCDDAFFPGAIDISSDLVQLSFYNSYAAAVSGDEIASLPDSSNENLNNCLLGAPNCIRFVRATLSTSNNPSLGESSLVNFTFLAPFMPFVGNVVPLPSSTVIMPAEALGLM